MTDPAPAGDRVVATLKLHHARGHDQLRFDADDGVWRVAYAFDPRRKAILLIAGDKSGVSEKRFYKALIKRADARFDRHLADVGTLGGSDEQD